MGISIDGVGLFVMATQGKWDKAKAIVGKWSDRLGAESRTIVNHKEIEQDVGFLCHISRTYPKLFPYTKNFYNTFNSWRYYRDDDGWKITSKMALVELASQDIHGDEGSTCSLKGNRKNGISGNMLKNAPSKLLSVSHFKFNVEAMGVVLQAPTPALRLIRGDSISQVSYGFKDASGGGFGALLYPWERNHIQIWTLGCRHG